MATEIEIRDIEAAGLDMDRVERENDSFTYTDVNGDFQAVFGTDTEDSDMFGWAFFERSDSGSWVDAGIGGASEDKAYMLSSVRRFIDG